MSKGDGVGDYTSVNRPVYHKDPLGLLGLTAPKA